MKEKILNIRKKIYDNYRKLKDAIPTSIGKKIFNILKITLLVTITLLIPILFTTLSTLMGAGTISSAAYYGVFYTIWAIFFLSLIALVFFAEYKNK